MATKQFCDKCDREVTDRDGLFAIGVPDGSTANMVRQTDLCERCLNRLKEWLQPDAKAAQPKAP